MSHAAAFITDWSRLNELKILQRRSKMKTIFGTPRNDITEQPMPAEPVTF